MPTLRWQRGSGCVVFTLFWHVHISRQKIRVWSKGYGLYGVQVPYTALMPRLPSVPPMLSHVTASESDRDSAVVTCEMCSLDVAPCTISRGRRTASACGTHAPMHPRSADMHAALTAEPHAPRNIIGGRSAHARDLGGTLHLSSLPTSLRRRRVHLLVFSASTAARRRSIPARPWRLEAPRTRRCGHAATRRLDSGTATVHGRARIDLRRAAVDALNTSRCSRVGRQRRRRRAHHHHASEAARVR